MALHNVSVPCYGPTGEDEGKVLLVDEESGRCYLTVRDREADTEIRVEVYFDDLQRAWLAVQP